MLIVATLIAIAGASPPATPLKGGTASAGSVCQTVEQKPVDVRGASQPRTLAQEPPAREIKAVLHTEGGCIKPIVVRDQVGAPPAR
jgi:hypothetical protein